MGGRMLKIDPGKGPVIDGVLEDPWLEAIS